MTVRGAPTSMGRSPPLWANQPIHTRKDAARHQLDSARNAHRSSRHIGSTASRARPPPTPPPSPSAAPSSGMVPLGRRPTAAPARASCRTPSCMTPRSEGPTRPTKRPPPPPRRRRRRIGPSSSACAAAPAPAGRRRPPTVRLRPSPPPPRPNQTPRTAPRRESCTPPRPPAATCLAPSTGSPSAAASRRSRSPQRTWRRPRPLRPRPSYRAGATTRRRRGAGPHTRRCTR
mmetsp:Transcript_45318/g.144013  ORF Transcript_45318/g.144013 Transcript_45318/m.144013 type:complete len:231 (-) Transcript_45318:729-1421(-)